MALICPHNPSLSHSGFNLSVSTVKGWATQSLFSTSLEVRKCGYFISVWSISCVATKDYSSWISFSVNSYTTNVTQALFGTQSGIIKERLLAILDHLGIKKVPVWEIFGTNERMCYTTNQTFTSLVQNTAQLCTQCTIWSFSYTDMSVWTPSLLYQSGNRVWYVRDGGLRVICVHVRRGTENCLLGESFR